MPEYSIVIPVYNRPDEVAELLESLTQQTYRDFEVILVEDGSSITSAHVVAQYAGRLQVHYFVKLNEGQGFARNYGFAQASGRWFVVFDSDCIIPPDYLQTVDTFLKAHSVDLYGGPDAAHPSFTPLQKAISHTMTSLFTTGGIRGRKSHVGTYHPRSFNMGMSRQVYEATRGYLIPFMAEDLEFSTRALKMGFRSALIAEAFVYHKRRTDWQRFYKQLKYFGRARVNLTRFHPGEIKLIHLFPMVFTLGWIVAAVVSAAGWAPGLLGLGVYGLYLLLVFGEALLTTRSVTVSLLTPVATALQMTAYAHGMAYEWIQKMRGIDPNTRYTEIY